VNRRELQVLAQTRLVESKALLRAGLPDGAYYLAGYSVECALKACIARSTRRHDFPDKDTVIKIYTHDLEKLVVAAKLEDERRAQAKSDPVFRGNWDVVKQWSEQTRYRRHDLEIARKLVEAIGGREHGILAWIKRHW